jgi:hypothetical protein
MNSRLNDRNILRTGKKILGAAGLAAFALFCAGLVHAQSKPPQGEVAAERSGAGLPGTPPSRQAPSATAPVQVAVEKVTQATTQDFSPKPTAPKGQSEGITVHGHWVIEVRNPDGKLVKHVEFENSIDPGFNLPEESNGTSSSPISVPGGAELLSAALNGQASPDPATWGIMLVGPAGLANLSNTANAPCVTTLVTNTITTSDTGPIDACILLPAAFTTRGASGILPENCTANVPPGVSCNTVSVPVGTNPNLTGLQISGSGMATHTGQIVTVATLNFHPCGNLGNVGSICPMSSGVGFASLTSSSNFPNSPINVTSGQTVAVNVAISFH